MRAVSKLLLACASFAAVAVGVVRYWAGSLSAESVDALSPISEASNSPTSTDHAGSREGRTVSPVDVTPRTEVTSPPAAKISADRESTTSGESLGSGRFDRASNIERTYEDYLRSLQGTRGLEQYVSASAVLAECVAADLDAAGRGRPIPTGDDFSLRSESTGSARIVSNGTLYEFDESEFPLYVQVRVSAFERLRSEPRIARGEEQEQTISGELRAQIDAVVASSLKTVSNRQ